MRAVDQENLLIRGNIDTAKHLNSASREQMDFSLELLDFFENAPIALHWLSGTGHVLWANKYELESLGYSSEEYIGHHIMEVIFKILLYLIVLS
jgi:PAS domain-containing protein